MRVAILDNFAGGKFGRKNVAELIAEAGKRGFKCHHLLIDSQNVHLGNAPVGLEGTLRQRIERLLAKIQADVVIVTVPSEVELLNLDFRKYPVSDAFLTYQIENSSRIRNLRTNKAIALGEYPAGKLLDVAANQILPLVKTKSADTPIASSMMEAILSVEREMIRTAELAPDVSEEIDHCLAVKANGALETVSDRQVVFSKSLWVKGWIDWNENNFSSLELVIGKKRVPLDIGHFRADVFDSKAGVNPMAFETELSLEGMPVFNDLEIWINEKSGLRKLWLTRSFWVDATKNVAQTCLVLSGRAERRGNLIVCQPSCSELTILSVQVYCKGRCVAVHPVHEDRPTETIKIPLSDLFDGEWLHLYVRCSGQAPVHWLSLEPETGDDLFRLIGARRGVVANTAKHPLDWAKNLVNGGTRWFVNGRSATATNVSYPELDLAHATGKVVVEADVDDGSHLCTTLWRHRREVADERRLSAIVVPPQFFENNRQVTSVPRVVLLRAISAPTDDLYVLAPLGALIEQGQIELKIVNHQTETFDEGQRRALLSDGAFVVVSRYLSDDWIQTLSERRHHLAEVFYLIDDDLTVAEADSALPLRYRRRMAGVANSEFQSMLHLCSRLIVTSDFLFHRYRSEKTELLTPPYIYRCEDLDHLTDLSEIRIEYHGTQGHRLDLEAIAPAIIGIHQRFPQVKFRVFMGGHAPLILRNLARVEIMKDLLWEDYKEMIRTYRAHIALAPMLRTPYNEGKSFVKVHDIARLGAVGVYSNRAPFNDVITHGLNGFLIDNDPLMWQRTLRWLVENPADIVRTATAAQELARKLGDVGSRESYWRERLCVGRDNGDPQ